MTAPHAARRLLPGVCLVALCLAVACLPGCVKRHVYSDQSVAMNNGKGLILALNDFATEYGSFPDQTTAKRVTENTGSTLNLSGDTANDYFRQLIAAGVMKTEEPCYAKTAYSPKKPDNNMTGSLAIAPGEVGFGYVMNGAKALPADDPNRVIAAAPLLNAAATGEFDPEPLQGKAALVYLDNSVQLKDINPTDHRVMLSGGKTFLENGPGTIWGTAITPVIKPPQAPLGWIAKLPSRLPVKGWWLVCAGLCFTVLALWVIFKRTDLTVPPPEP